MIFHDFEKKNSSSRLSTTKCRVIVVAFADHRSSCQAILYLSRTGEALFIIFYLLGQLFFYIHYRSSQFCVSIDHNIVRSKQEC